jgi:preprotein translocase subunit SecY
VALNAITNVFRIAELRARLLYTLVLLAVYRVGIFISTPGVDRSALNALMESQKKSGSLVNLFNLFSGGALEQMSIFGLGIMPYVSASIIMQLLAVVVPTFERLQKEGANGRQKLNQYTRYLSIGISVVQGVGIARALASAGRSVGGHGIFGSFNQVVVPNYEQHWLWFNFITVVSLTAGTAFIMWLGERITENGIGNGISLIIFAGIVARIPRDIRLVYDMPAATIVGLMVFMVVMVGIVVYIERGMRRIPIQYAKRMAGRRMFAGQATYFPMKVNSAGVIPPIFASALLSFPATLSTWLPFLSGINTVLNRSTWVFNGVYVALIIFFTYFYTALTFRSDDVADNIKKQGGYIPGIRPGRQTADYIERVLNRISFGGAVYLAAVCVIPNVLSGTMGGGIRFGGTALLIVVGVALDTVQQIEGHLISRNYEGFAGPRGPRIRGRLRVAA